MVHYMLTNLTMPEWIYYLLMWTTINTDNSYITHTNLRRYTFETVIIRVVPVYVIIMPHVTASVSIINRFCFVLTWVRRHECVVCMRCSRAGRAGPGAQSFKAGGSVGDHAGSGGVGEAVFRAGRHQELGIRWEQRWSLNIKYIHMFLTAEQIFLF